MNMKKYIIFAVTALFLTGCYPVHVNTAYNHSLTKSASESDRIFLTFANTKHASFSFILLSVNNHGPPHDLLKVRWKNPDRYISQFNGMNTTLKFMIDNEEIITLKPIKNAIFVGYNMEDKSSEEEITFAVSRADLEKLAYAKKGVTVELTGKHRVVNAKFTKWSTSRAFKNFVNNT
jgi:hypothetical protein